MKALIHTKSNFRNLNGQLLPVLRKTDRFVYCKAKHGEICFTLEEAKIQNEDN